MLRFTAFALALVLVGCQAREKTQPQPKVEAPQPPVLQEVRVTHADGQTTTLKGVELDEARRKGMAVFFPPTKPAPDKVKAEKTAYDADLEVGQKVGGHLILETMEEVDVEHGTVRVLVMARGLSSVVVGRVAKSGLDEYIEGVTEGLEEEGCKALPTTGGVHRWTREEKGLTFVFRLVVVEVGDTRLAVVVSGGGLDVKSATAEADKATDTFLKELNAPVTGKPKKVGKKNIL